MSEQDQLEQLLELSRSSNKKDRQAAASGLGQLEFAYPQAVAKLEELKNDKDKGVRKQADKALKALKGKEPPPAGSDGYSEEVGDPDLKLGEFDHETSMTAAEEDAAEEEAKGKGLSVKIIEENNLVIDPKGNFISREEGTGKIVIKNTGSRNRIYGIELKLSSLDGVNPVEGEDRLQEEIDVGELDPKETWERSYTFSTDTEPITTKVSYIDPSTNLLPNFRNSKNEPVSFTCTIEVTNTTELPLRNVVVDKEIGQYGRATGNNTTHGSAKMDDRRVTFTIEELGAGETATMTVEISGSLPDGVEAYETGNLVVSYEQPDLLYSKMEYGSISGISDLKQTLDRVEREEEPGVFDCEVHLENISEFVYEMLSLKVMAGGIDGEETPLIDWDGTALSENERELVPGEKNDFEFIFETDEGTPTFGRTLNFTVQSFVDKYTKTLLTVPPENLKFLSIGIAKDYMLKKVPSYRETVVPTSIKVKGIGTFPLEAVVITDSIPEGFSDVREDAIEVYYNGQRLTEGYTISGTALGEGPSMPEDMSKYESTSTETTVTSTTVESTTDEEGEVVTERAEVAAPAEGAPEEGFSTSQEEVTLAGRTLVIEFQHLEQNELFASGEGDERVAGLKENDLIEVRYPVTILKPKKDSEALMAPAKVEAWIYDAEDQKIVAGTQEEIVGIEVVHERINVGISKTTEGITHEGQKAYRITIEGKNRGNATVAFTLKDIIPTGFSIVGETVEDPPVASEEGKATGVGLEKVWKFENIAPEQTVKVVYTIVGEPGAKYNPRDALIVAQA